MTQQEIEAGLDALRDALLGKHFPLIVLIEDELEEANLFRMALREVGIAVEFMHFRDGNQAIDFFNGKGCYSDREKFPLPQLTVLDMNLHRINGLEVLHRVRMKPQAEQLIVVALTGSEDSNEIELAWSMEINGWVTKPQTIKELVEVVRWMLKTWLPATT